MVVQLMRGGARRGDPDTISRTREAFARQHLVRIRSFLAPDLLDDIARVIEGAEFQRRIHPDMDDALDVSLEDPGIRWRLIFLMNDPQLFSLIRELTGCHEIGFFFPVVYKIVPGQGHFDRWHDDAGSGNRLIGISINLSREPFEGGVLQIRRKRTEVIIHSEHNTGFGDAMLFRIGDRLEHFVTEVTGAVPRIALAGWFQRKPDYREVAREVFDHLQTSPAAPSSARM
jgi:hypothetical protein